MTAPRRDPSKPVRVTIEDPETGEVFETRILANDYAIITAGDVFVKSINAMGRTHMIAVGPPSKADIRRGGA